MNKRTKILIIALAAGVAILLGGLLYQHWAMKEIVEQMEFEKSELEEEYEDIVIQFDGYQNLDIKNDSLQDLLTKEQLRVQDLLEELRITKVTNARRIAELKKELATVRQVMVGYVQQIDSLNATNTRLTAENREMRRQTQQMQQQNTELVEANTRLTETVTLASRLEIEDFEVSMLNRHDRKTRITAQARKIEFDFALSKNITTETGLKNIYLRLITPEGELLQTDTAHVFAFENSRIGYSVVQEIEYAGERVPVAMYWSLQQELMNGYYNADFFIDGQLLGSFPFEFKK